MPQFKGEVNKLSIALLTCLQADITCAYMGWFRRGGLWGRRILITVSQYVSLPYSYISCFIPSASLSPHFPTSFAAWRQSNFQAAHIFWHTQRFLPSSNVLHCFCFRQRILCSYTPTTQGLDWTRLKEANTAELGWHWREAANWDK